MDRGTEWSSKMELFSASIDATWIPQILRFVFLYCGLDVILNNSLVEQNEVFGDFKFPFIWTSFLVSLVVTFFGRLWLASVMKFAPEPYLDEVFHIPQAQRYCQGDLTWDDKITTPPGLYIASILLNRVSELTCSVYHLRLFNVEVTAYVAAAAMLCKSLIEQPSLEDGDPRRFSVHAIKTGFNVAFFPVFFFFSGLYYTDVISTFVVLAAYVNQLRRFGQNRNAFSIMSHPMFICLGIAALVSRQTNIFWIVVYMGGLEVVNHIKSFRPSAVKTRSFSTLTSKIRFYAWRYSIGDIHDPPLDMVAPVDLVLCIISISIAAVCNLRTVLTHILSHLSILVIFVIFVVINGGVVLGDKSNHVATLHFAQLLYIWPFFAFFSVPLFIPQALHILKSAYRVFRPSTKPALNDEPLFDVPVSPAQQSDNNKPYKDSAMQHAYNFLASKKPSKPSAALQAYNYLASNKTLQALIVTLSTLVVATAIVHFNTIIHPFTLADNRHYMFYVFRYTILRAWWVRYALVPVYVFCGWLCWTALRGWDGGVPVVTRTSDDPWTLQSLRYIRTTVQIPRQRSSSSSSSHNNDNNSSSAVTETEAKSIRIIAHTQSPPASTALILFLATALSLMTAPLVEPRYFILPWVFWRLHVPPWPATPVVFEEEVVDDDSNHNNNNNSSSNSDNGNEYTYKVVRSTWQLFKDYMDVRFLLELAWFQLINAITMRVFVARPFYWRDQDGAPLDSGRVQRFMW